MVFLDITADGDGSKQSASDDSFWKLESLYNGSIGVNELISEVAEEESTIDDNTEKLKTDFDTDDKKSQKIDLCGIHEGDMGLTKLSPKNSESSETIVDFPAESMAIVCQSPHASSEELSRLVKFQGWVRGFQYVDFIISVFITDNLVHM